MDLFAQKTLKAGIQSGVEKIITFSLSDYMPYLIKTGYKMKMPQIGTSYLSDNRIIQWANFLKFANHVSDIECKHDSNFVSIWAHTGGTTGFPKTVLHTDKAYNAVAMQYMKSMSHRRGEVFLNIIVPFVVYGMLTCMHMPLCLGLTVAIIPKFEATDWGKYITKYRPNHIAGIPSYFSPMLQDEKLKSVNLSGIFTLAAGGDGLNEQLESELNIFLQSHGARTQLIKGYGMTEICSSAITAFGDYSKVGSVGIPLVKNNIKVFDNEKKCECKYGEIGEILLSSPSLMVCYKDNEKETDGLITTDDTGTKWVHTEDLGYVDEQGFLFLLGRMKRVMFVGPEGMAYKVFPKKIEDVIVSVFDISEACVISANNGNGFAPKAYLLIKQSVAKTEDEVVNLVRNACEEQLPEYLRPFDYVVLEELPKTSVGKVDYLALEKLAEEKEYEPTK